MSVELESQVRDYARFFESTTPPIELDEVLTNRIRTEPVRPLQEPRRRVPNWAYGLATAVAVLAVVGGLAVLLSLFPAPESSTGDEAPPQTTTTTAPTTTVALDPDGFLPVVPIGAGTELSFVAVDTPPGLVRDVVWFRDSFYAVTADESLHRSPDGFVWEQVESFESAWSDDPSAPHLYGDDHPPVLTLAADADRLVAVRAVMDVVGQDGECYEGHGAAGLAAAGLEVAVSTDAGSWTGSRIPVGVPEPAAGACMHFFPGAAASGPLGIIVSGTLSVEVDYHALVAARLGADVARSISTAPTAVDGELRFSTTDGIDHRIPLDELGLSAEVVASRGVNALAWWSPDGTTWRAVARGGPMGQNYLTQLVATDSGFLAAGDGSGLFSTRDGSSWETLDVAATVSLEDWDGAALVRDHGVVSDTLTRSGDPAPLPASEGFSGSTSNVATSNLAAGGAGIVGVALAHPDPPPDEGWWPRHDLVFSPDGVEWRRWTPSEFGGAPIQAMWVGPDRVLVWTHDGCCEDPAAAIDYPPVLWVGRSG